jgi:guanine deaminase
MPSKPGVAVRSMRSVRMIARRNFLVGGVYKTAGKGPREIAPSALATGAAVSDHDLAHMREALRLMRQAGLLDRSGGPFGAVIVHEGKVLAATGNSVMRDRDPSAHAEVNAIREACRKVGQPHLSDAVLYSSCEPCPMCYATAYWARIGKIFYGASWGDYSDLFDDSNIQKDLNKPYRERQVVLQQILRPEAQQVWAEFRKLPDRARY